MRGPYNSRMSEIPAALITNRSRPIPKANPEYSLQSIPIKVSTLGCTMPAPRISIQPFCLQMAQHDIWLQQVNGVLHLSRRVISRDIQCAIVVAVGLDFWSLYHLEAQRAEKGVHLSQHNNSGMNSTQPQRWHGQRWVECVAFLALCSSLQFAQPLRDESLHLCFDTVQFLADPAFLRLLQGTQLLELLSHPGL